jgi:glycosyltransferase involved in cell wall biosynthesis
MLDVSQTMLHKLKGLRVCFIAGTLGQGGAERQLFYIVKVLAEHGANPMVITLSEGETWEDPIRNLGVLVCPVGHSYGRVGRIVEISSLAYRYHAHLVQAQHFYTNIYAAIAARVAGCPSIGAVRNSGAAEMAEMNPLLAKLSLLVNNHVLCNSKAAVSNLSRLGSSLKRLSVLSNCIDLGQFPLQRRLRKRDTLRVLGVGRLAPQKRFDRFLRIVAGLVKGKVDVQAVIVGDGPLLGELKRLRWELGLDGHVEFVAATPEICAKYEWADVLLLTSDHEGTPNVLIEAAATGLPVVSSSVGDCGELVVDGETGFLFEPSDEEAAAKALRKLAENRDLREAQGARGAGKMRDERGLAGLSGKLIEGYSKLLNLPVASALS